MLYNCINNSWFADGANVPVVCTLVVKVGVVVHADATIGHRLLLHTHHPIPWFDAAKPKAHAVPCEAVRHLHMPAKPMNSPLVPTFYQF